MIVPPAVPATARERPPAPALTPSRPNGAGLAADAHGPPANTPNTPTTNTAVKARKTRIPILLLDPSKRNPPSPHTTSTASDPPQALSSPNLTKAHPTIHPHTPTAPDCTPFALV
jgi:hypothetical protein